MNRLGTVTHITGSGKLILRTKVKVKTGMKIVDEELVSVGKIVDVFGPIKNPYVSIDSTIPDPSRCVGHPLYIMSEGGRRRRYGRS